LLPRYVPRPAYEVPRGALTYLARQPGISDPGCIRHYQDDARWRHVEEIRESYGYRELTEPPQVFRLVRWLYTRASVSAGRPSVLFDHATAWLVEHKVLLPGVTTLARLIARIRERAAARLWQILSDAPTPEQRIRLEALLSIPEDGRPTTLERLRRAPTRVSGQRMLEALARLHQVRALGVGELDLSLGQPVASTRWPAMPIRCAPRPSRACEKIGKWVLWDFPWHSILVKSVR